MNNTNTPRTDAATGRALAAHYGPSQSDELYTDPTGPFVHAAFARQLERELAEANEYAAETHARHQSLVEQIGKLKDDNAALSAELREQAVVNGIGGSREAKLLAEMDKLRAEVERLKGELADWENAVSHAKEHRPDEVHCGCVAPLLGKLASVEADNAALREALIELRENAKQAYAHRVSAIGVIAICDAVLESN